MVYIILTRPPVKEKKKLEFVNIRRPILYILELPPKTIKIFIERKI